MQRAFLLNFPMAALLLAYITPAQTQSQPYTFGLGATPIVHLGSIYVEAATRNQVDINKYAGSVSVLNEGDLKSYANVMDAIKMIPGVASPQSMGREIGNNFQIRGFGYQTENRVIILQDGVGRSPSLYSNHISSFRTDSDLLKRVEVVKGASSIVHGSGAIGGIVSMQTKDARDYLKPDEYYGAMAGFRFEANNMRSGRAAVYAKGKEIPFDIMAYTKFSKFGDINLANGGLLDETLDDEEARTIFIKGGLDFLNHHRIQASFFDYDNSLNSVWQTLWHAGNDLFVEGDVKQRDYNVDYFFNPNTDLIDLSLKYYHSEASYDRGYDTIRANGMRAIVDYENEDKRWGINLKNISKFQTGPIQHNLVIGIDYLDREEDATWIENGVELNNFQSMPAKYKDIGVYLHNTMSFGKLELTLGGRYDHFDRDADVTNFSDSQFSPRAALSYELFNGFNLLAGYAESFRAPTPHEIGSQGPLNPHYWYLPNTDLKPETAKEYEIGFSYENLFNARHYVNIKGMYFNGDIEDMINLRPLYDMGQPPSQYPNQRYAQYRNVNNAERQGFELEARYANPYVGITATYEYMELKDKSTGRKINNYADKIMLGVQGYFTPNITLGMDISHYLKPRLEEQSLELWNGNTYYYADRDFTIVNVKGNIKMDEIMNGANLSFGVNNLFDDKYINANTIALNNQHHFVGKGRNLWVDLEMRF